MQPMRSVQWIGVLAVACLVCAAAHAAPPDERTPVPDAGARTAAVAAMKKEFREELKGKDADAKRKLAKTLLERAGPAQADPIARYVLLDQAVTLAEEARDVRLALDGVHRIAQAYQIPEAVAGLASVDAIARSAKDAGVLAEAATACVDLAGIALAANDPSAASTAVAAAKKHASAAKLGGLASRAAELTELIAAFRKASAAADAAGATLATTPDDAAAQEAVGRFLVFGRADWTAGLERLAKSPDAALKDAAAREARRPTDAAERQALADVWWQLAQKEKDPLARARMLARAASHYAAAPADAPAERRALVKQRLDAMTWFAWDRGIALTKDFSKSGPAGLALASIRSYVAQQRIDRNSDTWRTKLPRFPEVTFGPGVEYLWNLETNKGPITIRFLPEHAPNHVANFLYLTELGFFDDTIFHRVIPGFMAQGGGANKSGGGTPGYTFDGEYGGDRKHDRGGMLSMANTGAPASDGSEFFITFAAASHLDGKHTIFGEVISGMDAVKKLEEQGTEAGPPKSPLLLLSARVTVR